MSLFLETICIWNNVPQHLSWHQARVNSTFKHHLPGKHSFDLERTLAQIDFPAGKIKCTIVYDVDISEIKVVQYQDRQLQKLKLIEVPVGFQYSFKYADRAVIDELFSKRADADDVLMTRSGWITDTSIANIAFHKDQHWYTPIQPLLAGTTWKRLIFEKKIIPRPIHIQDLQSFDACKVFNAMNDFNPLVIGSAPFRIDID